MPANPKWTPGPWRVGKYHDALDIVGIFSEPNRSGTVTILSNAGLAADRPAEEREANATLAAAAPDLFAALSAFVDWEYEDDGGWEIAKLQESARAALLKANPDRRPEDGR